ncbi:MAG: hypothetical protein NTZ87_01420 [Candidatus Nomurabacteria bacterium]|nr:hypothetical protein [Candidatus Nomurabacteria bacterium]
MTEKEIKQMGLVTKSLDVIAFFASDQGDMKKWALVSRRIYSEGCEEIRTDVALSVLACPLAIPEILRSLKEALQDDRFTQTESIQAVVVGLLIAVSVGTDVYVPECVYTTIASLLFEKNRMKLPVLPESELGTLSNYLAKLTSISGPALEKACRLRLLEQRATGDESGIPIWARPILRSILYAHLKKLSEEELLLLLVKEE